MKGDPKITTILSSSGQKDKSLNLELLTSVFFFSRKATHNILWGYDFYNELFDKTKPGSLRQNLTRISLRDFLLQKT